MRYPKRFREEDNKAFSGVIGIAKRDIEDGEEIEIKFMPFGLESEAIDFSILNSKINE